MSALGAGFGKQNQHLWYADICIHKTHTHTFIHTHIYIYIYTHTHIHTHTHIYIYTHTHTTTHTHTHTHTHTQTHTHTHTHRGFWGLIAALAFHCSEFVYPFEGGRRPGKARGACDDPQLPLGALRSAQAQQPRGRLREEDQLAGLASVAVVFSGVRGGGVKKL